MQGESIKYILFYNVNTIQVYINLTGIVAIRMINFKDEVKSFSEFYYLEFPQDSLNPTPLFLSRVRISLKCDLEFPQCAPYDLEQTQVNKYEGLEGPFQR